ncbi:PREDICTED: polycystic kidney disease protein 1-like 2 [Branchiostoma belcheri]|uniref:Polycystic kidney disease protein 1-like 2 n=1 Tax=Branchiostoma belcheri TaxID=7741 RepID=A0A6P4YWK7_BRABE|nr:PREDICTED: polycystic kidney disease protein 1-like 2 [Branchiostoma belcheri]
MFVLIPITPSCFVNCNDRINPSERLVLVTSCENCPPDTAYLWSLTNSPASFGRADLDWAADTATGKTSQDLAVKANVLTVPGEYTLRLDVRSSSGSEGLGGAGFTEAQVNVNEPPTPGTCSVTPASGTTTSTMFSVSCRGFQDSDRPLIYALHYNDGQTAAFSVLFSGPQSQLPPTLLPVGQESRDFNVTLRVHVSDAFGAVAYSNNMTVQVQLPSAEETVAALGNLTTDLDNLLVTGNSQGVLQLASSIGSVLNTPSQDATNESITAAQEARSKLVTALESVEVQTVDNINVLASALGQVTAADDQVTPDAQVSSSSIALKMSQVLSSQSVQDLGAEGLEASAGNVLSVVVNTLQASSTSATAQRRSGASEEGQTQLAKNQQATTTMFGAMGNVNGAILDRKTPDESKTTFEFGTFGIAVDKERCSVTSSAPKVIRTSETSQNFFVVPGTSTLLGGSCRGESSVGTENFQSKKNPYAYSGSSDTVESSVNGLQVRGKGGPLAVSRLTEPVQIVTERTEGLPTATEQGSTVPSWQQAMSMHSFNVSEEGSSIHITVLSVEQNVSLRLYLRRNNRPTRTDFDLNTTLPRPDDETFKIQLWNNQSMDQSVFNWFISADEIVTVGGVGEYTLGVDHVPYAEAGSVDQGLETEYSHVNFTTNYTMQIFTTTCLFFNEDTQAWLSDGCKAGPLTSDRFSHCFCDHLTSFGSGFTFFVAPNSLNILQALQGFLNIGENPAVVICVSVIFGLYLLLVIWGRHKDKEDAKKVGATLLRASKRGHGHFYRIMVFTGPRTNAGTTARVYMKLFGESGEAGPVVLEDVDRVTFRQGAVDTFVLSSDRRLGELNAVHVWHDNTGGDPSWYLNKIVVIDCDKDDKYTFICDKWLAVEEGDGKVDRLLAIATEKELSSIGNVFSSKTSKDFRDGHLWFSVMGRPAYSRFTRVQRLSCCLSLLLCTMLTNIMFFGRGETFPKPPPVDILGFEVQFPLSWGEIMIAVQSALIVFPVNLAIVQIFRHCGQRPKKEKKNESRKKENKTKTSNNTDSSSLPSHSTTSTASIEFDNTLDDGDIEVTVHSFSSTRDESGQPAAVNTDDSDWLFHKVPYQNSTGNDIEMVEATWIRKKNKDVSEVRGEKKKKGTTLLPWWCVFFAYFLVFVSCFLSAFFTMLYGFEYGREKAEAWLLTFLTSFFIDLLITQPFKIVLLAVFFALILRKVDSEDEEVPAGQLEEDEIYMAADMENWSMPTTTEANPPTPEDLAESRAQRFRELTLRAAFKELLFYLLFITVLVIVANGPRDSMMYHQTKHLRDTFFIGGGNHSLQKATTFEKFWNFVELALVPEISSKTWYNGMALQTDGYLRDYQSFIAGTVRFRQLRVKQDEQCKIPTPFLGIIDNCDEDYGYFANDDRHYTEGWAGPANITEDPIIYENYTEEEQPWLYHSPTLYDIPTSGRYATYYGGGYIVELTNTTTAALLSTVDWLESSGWIDQHTRAVFVQFTIFNPNTNLFSIMELMTEFPTLGSSYSKVEATTVRLFRFQTVWSKVVAAFQGVFVLFTLYFVFRELSRIMLMGFEYFKMFWNCLELCLALLSLAEIGILLYTLYLILGFNTPQRNTEATRNSYEKYRQAALWDQINTYVLGWLVCVATLKLLHLFRFNKHIVRGADTMKKASGPLSGFGIMFGIMFCSFTMLFYLVVGTKLEGFATFPSALQTILVIIQSASSYYVIAEASSVLGPLAYFALLGLFQWVMLLMFVAILDEAYHEAMAEQKGGKTENEKVADMMIQRVKTAALTVVSCGRRENRMKTYEVRRRPTEQELLDIFNGPELIRMVEEKGSSTQTFEFVLKDNPPLGETNDYDFLDAGDSARNQTSSQMPGYNLELLSEEEIADVFAGFRSPEAAAV